MINAKRRLFTLTKKHMRTSVLGALFALVGVLALSTPAFAQTNQNDADRLTIREVDTTDFPNVKLTVLPPASSSLNDLRVTENGKSAEGLSTVPVAQSSDKVLTLFVVDTSQGSYEQDAIAKSKAALTEYIKAAPTNEQIGVVATSGVGRVIARPTADKAAVLASLDRMVATDKNALWKSVTLAGGLISESNATQYNVIAITTGNDASPERESLEQARVQLNQSGATVFGIDVATSGARSLETLREITANSGGRYTNTTNADTLSQLVSGLRTSISNQAVVKYRSTQKKQGLDITVTAGAAKATARTGPGTRAVGSAVNPTVTSVGKANLLAGPLGRLAIVIAAFACFAMLVFVVSELFSGERDQLKRALRPYSEDTSERDISRLADSEIFQRALKATERVAESRGILQSVESRLQQADLPLKPAEALFFTGVVAIIAVIIGFVFMQFLGMFAAAFIFAFAPFAIISFLAGRRRRKFTSQLPDTLQLLSGSLRAGYSFVQGLDAVAKQCEAPMGTELTRAISEARLGRPVEDALDDVCERMNSEDFKWAVMAIKIQREVGGNLAELLMTVAETMVARERLRREVLALTAEGRISAIILSGLPFAISAVIMVLNPDYMQPLLTKFIGQLAIAGAVIAIVVGYLIMNKLIKIEA